MKKYGLPYKGSKSKLADAILEKMPNGEVFVDLFAGGRAMTHAAMLSGRFKRVLVNDLTDIPQVFVNALQGKYDNEDRWISREDFFRLKDTDPYVRLIWSFGNNCRDYLYSKEIEPLKKAMHWAVYYRDAEPLKEFGYDVTNAMEVEDRYKRWLAVKHIMQERMQHANFTMGRLQSMKRAISLPKSPYLNLSVSQGNYQDVPIPEGAVVYADPPYRGTNKYQEDGFDHERFADQVYGQLTLF